MPHTYSLLAEHDFEEVRHSFQLVRLRMQGHVDMVTEKNNDVKHDFFNDPLRLKSDGSWLKVRSHAEIVQLQTSGASKSYPCRNNRESTGVLLWAGAVLSGVFKGAHANAGGWHDTGSR